MLQIESGWLLPENTYAYMLKSSQKLKVRIFTFSDASPCAAHTCSANPYSFRRTLVTTFIVASTNSISQNTNGQITSSSAASPLRSFSTKDNTPKDTDTMTNVKTPDNIDEFRAREEQRELDHEQQQTEHSARQSTDNFKQPTEESDKIKRIRTDILNASLLFVGTHGWSRDAIASGGQKIGYPGIIHGMFANGGIELINHFYMQCNERLMDQLNDEVSTSKDDGPTGHIENPLDMLKRALRLRLQMNEPYLSTWHQALAVMALPQNVPTSLAQLLTLVDDICHYAGDRSVDVRLSVFKRCGYQRAMLCNEMENLLFFHSLVGIRGALVWRPFIRWPKCLCWPTNRRVTRRHGNFSTDDLRRVTNCWRLYRRPMRQRKIWHGPWIQSF